MNEHLSFGIPLCCNLLLIISLHLHEDVKQILDLLVIASTTWQAVATFLYLEIENTSQVCNENQEVISKLILDLLIELKNRNLFLLKGEV